MMKHGDQVQCTNISSEFEFVGQRSKAKVTRTKNEKGGIFRERSSGSGARVVSSASCTPVGKSAHAVYNLLKSVFLKPENSANKLLFEVFCQESARRNVAKMKDKSIK